MLTPKERLKLIFEGGHPDRPACICPGGMMNTEALESIDGLGLTLRMTSSRPNSRLNAEQSLAARLSISVPGGITLDIKNLTDSSKK